MQIYIWKQLQMQNISASLINTVIIYTFRTYICDITQYWLILRQKKENIFFMKPKFLVIQAQRGHKTILSENIKKNSRCTLDPINTNSVLSA